MGHYITPNPINHSPEGWPIFLFEDDQKHLHYVVVLPDGTPRFCDQQGRPRSKPPTDAWVGGAILGGLLGALAGPMGAAVGALVGAAITANVKADQ